MLITHQIRLAAQWHELEPAALNYSQGWRAIRNTWHPSLCMHYEPMRHVLGPYTYTTNADNNFTYPSMRLAFAFIMQPVYI